MIHDARRMQGQDDNTLRQVWLARNHVRDAQLIGDHTYTQQLQELRESLLISCPDWEKTNGFDQLVSPLPLTIPRDLPNHVQELGDILQRAITNIVERWWTDAVANFPGRMPVLPHEEEVLRWIDGPGKHSCRPFTKWQGSWRPDFLLEGDTRSNLSSSSGLKICEINARFSFNGFFVCAYSNEAFERKNKDHIGLVPPVSSKKIFDAFEGLIDLDKPFHLLKGHESGLDIHLFDSHLRDRCGVTVRFIQPSDLRLINRSKAGGTNLYSKVNSLSGEMEELPPKCLLTRDGEVLEPIYQVALELHQQELKELGTDVLRALAPLCFNDLRTIYLVHDKRMLGILQQELQSLVEEHHILTAAEADLLRCNIVPTILPGTLQMRKLAQKLRSGLESKEDLLLKPTGSGKGHGIIFGSDTTPGHMFEELQRLSNANVEGQNYVVQRVVKQAKYDVIVSENDRRSPVLRQYIVGTFMMMNGQTLGIAGWRTSPNRICALRTGGASIPCLTSYPLPKEIPEPPNHRMLVALPSDPTPKEDVPYRMPVWKMCDATDASHVETVNTALQKDGILILDLKFDDQKSDYLMQLVHGLVEQQSHGPPLTHSSTRGWLWDVKPTAGGVSRSEGMEIFPWHTDCSYVPNPPRFFGLHVLQADRCGGGTLSLMRLSKAIESMSEDTVQSLCAPEFRIDVPVEFSKGATATMGPLLSYSDGPSGDGQLRCRFRADIVHPLTPRAEKALAKLEIVLAAARTGSVGIDLNAEALPSGSVVLLDNSKWFHARNEVRDAGRHLRRVRWDARKF